MDPNTSPPDGAPDGSASNDDAPEDVISEAIDASGPEPASGEVQERETLAPGARVTATLERPAALGRSVAHHGGMTLLVGRGLPGESVEVEIGKVHPNFALGRAVRVETGAVERVVPPCPHYEVCGGCDWQHAAYPAQLEMKKLVLSDQFERIGRMDPPLFEIERAPEPLGYRDRLDFIPVAGEGRWQPGFHGPDGSPPVAVSHCRLAPESLTRLAAEVLVTLQNHGILPSPDAPGRTGLSLTRMIVQGTAPRPIPRSAETEGPPPEAISPDANRPDATPPPEAPPEPESEPGPGLSLVLTLKSARGEKPRTLRRRYVEALRAVLPDLQAAFPALIHLALKVIPGGGKEAPSFERLLGSEWLPKRVGDIAYLAPPGGFFQVHPALTGRLVSEVVEAVRAWVKDSSPPPGMPVFDLFGGSGLFALPLAGVFREEGKRRVVCADSESAALRAGDGAAKAAKLSDLRFERLDLERAGALEALIKAHGMPGAVVCDPPRRGLPGPLVAALKNAPVSMLIYVSCDGGTLARDAARLAPDYTLTRMRAFDLFPQTHHLESVAVFQRQG